MRGPATTRLIVGAMVCAWVIGGGLGAVARDQDPRALDRAAALRTFIEEVERYASLRTRYEAPLASFDVRRDPWSVRLQRAYLASAIRSARRQAGLGDVFTAPVAQMFRGAIGEVVHVIDIEGLVDEDVDSAFVDLAVNEPVPLWAMRPVPDVLLERLPPLPVAIEYRFVADALILWDTHAEILIDALPGAFLEP